MSCRSFVVRHSIYQQLISKGCVVEDRRSIKALEICQENIKVDCDYCPLRQPCKPIPGDSKEAFDIRMNAAAEELPTMSDKERGITDCAEGIPHKDGQGDSYDEGYAFQYELEQRASANER